MSEHEKYMQRCLDLASNGLGSTYPNPLVGCVIVHKGEIIGEGWHRRAGEAHAEVNAIDSVSDKSLLKNSELYVNLEPCSHHGRTPPCADLIVKMKIPRIYIGSRDENAMVSGAGIKRMEDNGCQVTLGLLESRCRDLNRRFFTFHREKRPYIILKWAQSKDGFLFPAATGKEKIERSPVWISNKYSRQIVHKWRSEEEAILVGTRTAEQDDPSLTVRDVVGNAILRLVIDRKGQLSRTIKVFQGESSTVVFTDIMTDIKKDILLGAGSLRERIRIQTFDFQEDLPGQIATFLWEEGIQSLIVEGGAATLNSFIQSGLWDEARVFVGQTTFGDGLEAPILKEVPFKEESIRGDRLFWIYPDIKTGSATI